MRLSRTMHSAQTDAPFTPAPGTFLSRRTESAVLVAILLIAAALRLVEPGQSPPGLNVDEAVNAWNAWSLLQTGMDQHGVPWPVFDSRGFGQGMTTVYLYALIPFQARFGLSAESARLPAAVGGVLAVLLLFYVGRRLFGGAVGLAAAGLLAINPWHIQQSRWGHMGALFPLLVLLALAAMLAANLPLDDLGRKPRVRVAFAAGLLAGACSYGYFAARLFIPVFAGSVILAALWKWWPVLRDNAAEEGARRSTEASEHGAARQGAGAATFETQLAAKNGREPAGEAPTNAAAPASEGAGAAETELSGPRDIGSIKLGELGPRNVAPPAIGGSLPGNNGFRRAGGRALAAFAIGFALTFGPLALKFMTDPTISRRAEVTWVWSESDSLVERVGKVLARYPGHYGPDFLFLHGDTDAAYAPPEGYGLFLWYSLPLMLIGAITIGAKLRGSRAARVLAAWVLVYPAADLLSEHPTLHSLRSLPGVCALTLLAAVGAVAAVDQAKRWVHGGIPAAGSRRVAASALAALFLLAAAETAVFLGHFFGSFNREQTRYHVGHVDLLEACAWLRPRLDHLDAVYVTGAGMSHPYIYTLVALGYDPRQWFRDTRNIVPGPLPNGAYANEDIYTRYGKMRFMIGEARARDIEEANALMTNGRDDHVVFIVRPGEMGLDGRYKPALELRNPRGGVELQVFDIVL